MLRVLHPLHRRLHGVDPRLDPPRGHDLPRRFRFRRQPLPPALVQGAALEGRSRLGPRQLHARRRRLGRHDQVRRQDATCGEDGRPRRRASGRGGVHLVQGEGGGEGPSPRRSRVRHVARLAALGIDPVPECEQLGPRDGCVHGVRGGGHRLESDRPHGRHRAGDHGRPRASFTRWRKPLGSAPTRAFSTTRRSTRGIRAPTQGASTPRTRAPSTCTSTTRRAISRRST